MLWLWSSNVYYFLEGKLPKFMKLFIKYCTQHEVFLQLNNFVDSGVKAQKLNCDKKLGNKNYLE